VLFWLGTHQPSWLRQTDVPLFVSARRLRARRPRALPPALGPVALDSGAFTELSAYGRWTVPARQYADEVRGWAERPGLVWAAIQDWMCEPFILEKTGGTIRDHQRRSLESYLELSRLAPEVLWVPVLQGWHPTDYYRHLDDFKGAGVDLFSLPLVGVGSVCRRQATQTAEGLIRELYALGLRLHAFGFKLRGLRRVSACLVSSDSMAWSYGARRRPALRECRGRHRNCANCLTFALRWRRQALRAAAAGLDVPPPLGFG
jgi:hypothetical protein